MEQIQIEDIMPYLVNDRQVLIAFPTAGLTIEKLVEYAKKGAAFIVGDDEEMRKAVLYSSKDRAVLFSHLDGNGQDPNESKAQLVNPAAEKRTFDKDLCRSLWEAGNGVTEISRKMQYTDRAVSYHLNKMQNDGDLKRQYRKA